MTLADRIAALATAIGADIRALISRVSSLEQRKPAMPELSADPASPNPGEAWVRRSMVNDAGTLQAFAGGFPMATQSPDYRYELSFATVDEGTKRVELT